MRELSGMDSPPRDSLSCFIETVNVRLVTAHKSEHMAPWFFRAAEGMAGFYVVVNGRCCLQLDGEEESMALETGDLAVLLHGKSHWLHDNRQKTWNMPGDSSLHTTIVRGRFVWGKGELPSLLPQIPLVVHFRNENGRLVSWMTRIIQKINDESASKQPGARAIINHMAYVIFAQSVRACLTADPPAGGQVMEYTHPRQIGQALYLLHNQPEEPWSLPLLARECGMSRSAFADEFKRATGKPPMTYLLEYRMKRACDLLSQSSLGIKEVSALVGYGSQPAFSNAFRRCTGLAPGVYRKIRR
jgi:AraC-like DNA-binding protein